jgi:hypothetical protein
MAAPSFGESLVHQHTISGLLLRWPELHITRLSVAITLQAFALETSENAPSTHWGE